MVSKIEVPAGSNILRGKLVLAWENVVAPDETHIARFAVQGYAYCDKSLLVLASVNSKQQTIRIMVAVAAVIKYRLWMQDVAQAYVCETVNRRCSLFTAAPQL